MRTIFLVVALAFGLGACGDDDDGGKVIKVSDYDTSCSVADDCTWIKLGATCDCCDFGAINKKDVEKYIADRGDTSTCDPPMPPFQEPVYVCENSVCAMHPDPS